MDADGSSPVNGQGLGEIQNEDVMMTVDTTDAQAGEQKETYEDRVRKKLNDMLPFLLSAEEPRREGYLKRLDNLHKTLVNTSLHDQKAAVARLFTSKSPHTPHDPKNQKDSIIFLPLKRNRKRAITDMDDGTMTDGPNPSSTPTQPQDDERRKRRLKLRPTRHARKHMAVFLPITLALSDTFTIEYLKLAQIRFVSDLSVRIKSLNPGMQFQTSDQHALEIRRVFFEGMLGYAMLGRLAKLCHGYTSDTVTESLPTKSTDMISLTPLTDMMIYLTLKDGMPDDVKDCYEALCQYHSMSKINIIDDNSNAVNSPHQDQQPQNQYKEPFAGTGHDLLALDSFRLFSDHLDNILSLLDLPDTDLVSFFKSKNLVPTLSQDGKISCWSTAVIAYLCQIVGISQGEVEIMRSQMMIVDGLIKEFGEGILVLVLVSAAGGLDRLVELGEENLLVASSLLKRHVPQLQLVCDWMDSCVYQPVMKGCGGLPVKTEVLSVAVKSGDKSLLDVLGLAGGVKIEEK